MVRMDPIVGRFTYIPYEGTEYRVYFEEAGQGVPLVCLHTAGADCREWRHQLCDPDITRDFRVPTFDLPRHGKSLPPDGWWKEDYRLTAKFYGDFVMAFCRALELEKLVVMGSSMGGNICLHLALRFTEELRALIAVEGCDYSPGGFIDWWWHPHVHGGEVAAAAMLDIMAPHSPENYRWETCWYYAQGGPGVFKGDLYFYSVDHDFREGCGEISGKVPMYFLTGENDFACTPELAATTAKRIKNAEAITMREIGHFPMSENPALFKRYLMPVLEKILRAAPSAG